jgi:hypothetical protein
MLTKSPTESLRSRERLVSSRGGETRLGVRVRTGAVAPGRRGGDTDALDWRSDPRLVAILARSTTREREAREA